MSGNITNGVCSIIGVPFSGGQPKGGVEMGPASLREAGLDTAVSQLGWVVGYDNDINITTRTTHTKINKMKDPVWVGAVSKDLFFILQQRVVLGDFCLVLGGDHSIAVGSIASALTHRPDTCVVWVDAHADINTPETTDSGNLHGMPVAFLSKLAGEVSGFEWLKDKPTLRPDRLIYVGLRDVDEGEKALLKQKSIKHFWAQDVARMGIDAVMEEVVAFTKDLPIHISFDVDALDPKYAPATGTPVRDGITLEDGEHLCSKLSATGRLVSMDVVEVNPILSDNDGAETTLNSSIRLIKAAMEGRRLN